MIRLHERGQPRGRGRDADGVAERRPRPHPVALRCEPPQYASAAIRPSATTTRRLVQAAISAQRAARSWPFRWERLFARWSTPNRRQDVGVRQDAAPSSACGRSVVAPGRCVQRRHQEVARPADAVAREHPARPIRAVCGRCEAHHEHARARVAEPWHRARPSRYRRGRPRVFSRPTSAQYSRSRGHRAHRTMRWWSGRSGDRHRLRQPRCQPSHRRRARRPVRARGTSCARAGPTRRGRSRGRARCASARRTRRDGSSAPSAGGRR